MATPDVLKGLRPGSFRGVAFFTRGSDFESGRRGIVLEPPQAEYPRPQDFGPATRSYNVEAVIIGDDYLTRKRELIEALEKPGPGKLVHRYYGEFQAVVEPGRKFRVRETPDQGGMAVFQIPFVRVSDVSSPTAGGARAPGTAPKDTKAAVGSAAAKAKKASIAALALKLLTTGPEFVRTNVLGTIVRTTNEVAAINGQINAALSLPGQINAEVRGLGSAAGSLLATPARIAELATTMFGIPETALSVIASLAYSQAQIVEAFTAEPTGYARELARKAAVVLVQSIGSGMAIGAAEPTIGTASLATAMGARIAGNRAAVIQLYRQATVISAASATTSFAFDSDETVATVTQKLDGALVQLQADADDGETYRALADLRAATVEHLARASSDAPRVRTVVPMGTTPALLVAHRETGDARNVEELISRNGLRHPLFAAGGRPLKVLVDG